LLEAAAHCTDLPVGDVCAELLRRMAPRGGYRDDVVLLALRPSHTTLNSFATVVPAVVDQIPVARRGLRRWLDGINVEPGREHDILLGIGEAVSNAIEHGSTGSTDQTVAIEAFVRGGTVAATVSDSGTWSRDSAASHRDSQRGRGLTLMNGLADRVDTVRTTQGTRVTLQFNDCVYAVDGSRP
ncbi:MAG TPA: ATP-binding protein, partial [Mycobacterium sp.]|nr:ATP-binding protein [Mycobacterium sp.]